MARRAILVLLTVGLAAAVYVADRLARSDRVEAVVREERAARARSESRAQDRLGPRATPDDRRAVPVLVPDAVIEEDDLPPVDEPTTSDGPARLTWPVMDSSGRPPEVISPLPDASDFVGLDGDYVTADYEDGTRWFEAHRALDADGEWRRDGLWTCWHSNGELHEQGAYRDGVEHGAWSWWYPDGNRMSTGAFTAGARDGAWRWYYDTGDLAVVGAYRDGTAVGTWTMYHTNGVRQAEGPFANGRPNGAWTVWSWNGAVDASRTGEYVDGEMVE